MTNTAMIMEVEERINKAENLVKFPVRFTKSKKMFEELDTIIVQMKDLREKANRLEAEANDAMMEEYMENEGFRIAHEFLSSIFEDANRLRTMQIGEGVVMSLAYGNSKAIQDHEGRWFRTISDACRYHGVSLATYYYRKKKGMTLDECFARSFAEENGREVVK